MNVTHVEIADGWTCAFCHARVEAGDPHICTISLMDPQPPPITTSHPAIQDLVMVDLAARKRQGIAKYGTPLQPHNGRDALTDAYQEAIDLAQYLRQAIYERDGR